LALQLARLYDYMQARLVEAAADPTAVAQLEEVSVLLGNLQEGWQQCEPPPAAAEPAEDGRLDPTARLEDAGERGTEDFAVTKLPAALPPAACPGDRVWTL
jgi:hypothetical protein